MVLGANSDLDDAIPLMLTKCYFNHHQCHHFPVSLRNAILLFNRGKMLSSGVNHIISQVVNPKIQKVFKPQIDAVVCEFFGVDPEEWAEKLRLRDEQRSERFKQLPHADAANNQSNTTGQMGGEDLHSLADIH